jgi:metal-dependent amidase/aminoacylase/carboxypeptidase family protein
MRKATKEGLVLKQGIKFCFQPGEEGANGAERMLNDIAVYDIIESSPRVTNCYGLHLASILPLKEIHYCIGPYSAASERWEIDIVGNESVLMIR